MYECEEFEGLFQSDPTISRGLIKQQSSFSIYAINKVVAIDEDRKRHFHKVDVRGTEYQEPCNVVAALLG